MSRPRPSPACPWRCGKTFTDPTDEHPPECPTRHGGWRPGWLRGVGACTLAYGDNPKGRCAWDGRPLPARRRRWCSNTCEQAFTRNHDWQRARAATLKRDGMACVRCGAGPDRWAQGCLVVWLLMGQPGRHDPTFAWSWHGYWAAPWALEVNHVTPVRGRHGEFGCHHHQEGLETLCHTCHREVTARQRARGWVAVGEPGPPVEQLPLVP